MICEDFFEKHLSRFFCTIRRDRYLCIQNDDQKVFHTLGFRDGSGTSTSLLIGVGLHRPLVRLPSLVLFEGPFFWGTLFIIKMIIITYYHYHFSSPNSQKFPQFVTEKHGKKMENAMFSQGECFAKMMELGLEPTAETFRILVTGAAKEAKDLDAATRLGAR